MTRLVCPALRSDDTLGFLAALGLLELCSSALRLDARLGWEGLGGAAILDVDVDDIPALADLLHALAVTMAADGRVTPAPWAQVVPARLSKLERDALKAELGKEMPPNDTLRMPATRAADHYGQAQARELDPSGGDPLSARWVVALVSQLASDAKARRIAPLLPMSNQMTAHQQLRAFRDVVVAKPNVLSEALVHWRRVGDEPKHKGIGAGAYLDSRALRDAVTTGSGEPDNLAVPGATWLAMNAIPFFPQVGEARRGRAVGWAAVRGHGFELVWPVWTRTLDRAAVSCLLSHPAIPIAVSSKDRRPSSTTVERKVRERRARELVALGVLAICRSHRRPLSNSNGVLLPPHVEPIR